MSLEQIQKQYRSYRWFFTSTDKLVIGGKSSNQNDLLLSKIIKLPQDLTVMHTALPGSPFSIILSDKSPTKNDLEQTAIFTASFSQTWKQKTKKAEIHVFNSKDLQKDKNMKTGTWRVNKIKQKMNVPLELYLTQQEGILRAVPEKAIKLKSERILRVFPGNISKEDILPKLQIDFPDFEFNKEELLQALPAGGLKVEKAN